MRRVALALLLLAQVLRNSGKQVDRDRAPASCTPTVLGPAPGSAFFYEEDVAVTVVPKCCQPEDMCSIGVFADGVFEGIATTVDGNSRFAKFVLPKFGLRNLGGHLISVVECVGDQEYEDLSDVKDICAVAESMVWISESNTAAARANMLRLQETFRWTSNWDRFVQLQSDLFLDRTETIAGPLPEALQNMLHLGARKQSIAVLRTSRPSVAATIGTHHCSTSFDNATSWTISVMLNFGLLAEGSVLTADRDRGYFNGECIAGSFVIPLQMPSHVAAHNLHHLTVFASNHRSGGTISFSTLFVLDYPGASFNALSAAEAVRKVSQLARAHEQAGPAGGNACSGAGGQCQPDRGSKSVSDAMASYHTALTDATSTRAGFARFRSSRRYTYVLEGAGAWYAAVCLHIIERQSEWVARALPSIARSSDAVGGPRRVWLPARGLEVAPQTVVYCKVASDLLRNFGSLDGMRIVEIGGGYGGQMKVTLDLFAVAQYVMIDLDPALTLQEQYLAHYPGTLDVVQWVRAESRSAVAAVGRSDLVVSNYAWIECSVEDRDWYWEHVLAPAQRGYVVSNGPWLRREVQRTLDSKPNVRAWKVPDGLKLFTKPALPRAELPARETCPDQDWRNCIVVWG